MSSTPAPPSDDRKPDRTPVREDATEDPQRALRFNPGSSPAHAALRWLALPLLRGCADALDTVGLWIDDRRRTARFLEGRLLFRPQPDDIYVVTYPRSGTTWVQYIVYLLVTGGRTDFIHLSHVSPWWERSLAGRAGTPARFAALRRPRIFKSHLPYRWLPPGARYIYVVRDGADVAVSYYHLYRSHLGYQGSLEEFFERFVTGRLQYGSWFRHVAGWREQAANPAVLFLRYDRLLGTLPTCVRRIARFLELPVTEHLVRQIADQSCFEAMKQQEHKFDHVGELLTDRDIRPGAFIRRGQSGEGHARLTSEQRRRFRQQLSTRPRLPGLQWRIADFLH